MADLWREDCHGSRGVCQMLSVHYCVQTPRCAWTWKKKKLNKTTKKKRQNSDFFFSWKWDISVINLFIEDFKAELTHRLVRLVTETPTPGFVLMVWLFFCLLSVTNPVRRDENILTCKDEKDLYTFLLPTKFPKSVFYCVLRTKQKKKKKKRTSALQYSWFTYGYMPHASYALSVLARIH